MSQSAMNLPRFLTRSPTRRRGTLRPFFIEYLEYRLLLSINPTPLEQELLEHVNRMRTDPQNELDYLFSNYSSPLTARDSDVQASVDFFRVNATNLETQFSTLVPVPPVAWNEDLYDAATAHNEAMIAADEQSHQLPGEGPVVYRTRLEGYGGIFGMRVGENVFAHAESTLHAHAGFAVDWGFTSSGIQSPPEHRNTIMDPQFQEVGIAVEIESNPRTHVGSHVVTQDFGFRVGYGQSQLLGVAFEDRNGDGNYDAGEGIGDVTITVSGTGGTYQTTTMSAGGYQLRVPAGTWTVTASRDAVSLPQVRTGVVVGNRNVKVDFEGNFATALPAVHTITLPDGSSHSVVLEDDESDSNGISEITIDGIVQTIVTPLSRIVIEGGDHSDSIEIRSVDSTYTGLVIVNGRGGGDSIDASSFSGRVSLVGGAGDDVLHGSQMPSTLIGGAGDDELQGGPSGDTLAGSAGSDTLHGAAGNDRLAGQAGHGDVLTGGSGDDRLHGGPGIDILRETADVDFSLTKRRLIGVGEDRLVSIEQAHLTGGPTANTIDASRFFAGIRTAVTLLGAGGDDSLSGSRGSDRIDGQSGNDTLTGHAGSDSLYGASGKDVLFGGAHHDLLFGGEDDDSLFGLAGRDSLAGGSGDDMLDGGDGRDRLAGQSGADLLRGGRHDDVLFGDAGNDRLFAGGGRDTALGGDGMDVVRGNAGHDVLSGGSGNSDSMSEDTVRGSASEIDDVFRFADDSAWMWMR